MNVFLSRTPTGSVRFACPDRFTRAMALRKIVRLANGK